MAKTNPQSHMPPQNRDNLVSLLKSRFERIDSASRKQSPVPPSGAITTSTDLTSASRSSYPPSSTSGALFSRPFKTSVDPDNSNANASLWQRAQKTIAAEKRWQDFENRFKRQESVLSIETILEKLKTLRVVRQDEQWSFGAHGRIKPRAILDRIVGYASDFKDIGATIARCDPTQHAGLAWSILQCLVTFAVNNKLAQDLANDHEFIAEIMCRTCIYANLYLEQTQTQCCERLSEAIHTLYVQVLKFLMEAWVFTEQGKLRHALQSISASTPVGEAKTAVHNADQNLAEFQRVADAEVTVGNSNSVKLLKDLLQNLRDEQERSTRQVDYIRAAGEIGEREAILNWISPIRQWDRYDEVKSHTEGTGDWLFSHPQFHEWRDSQNPSMLWLRGKMGSGKSTLTAMVLQALDHERNATGAGSGSGSMAFFFCDRTSRPQELTDVAIIFRVILKQIMRNPAVLLPAELMKQYNQRKSDGQLSGDLCLTLLFGVIAKLSECLTICIDALDECSQPVRTALLQQLFLPLLKDGRARLKIFISSRPGPDFERSHGFDILEPNEHIHVVQLDYKHDIELFIDEKLNQVLDPDYFDESFQLTKKRIIAKFREKADGMFRWVQLALEQVQQTPEQALEILEELPEGLRDAYNMIFARIPKRDQEIVLETLLLVSHTYVSLSLDELVEAVFDIGFEASKNHLRLRILRCCSQFVVHDLHSDELRLAHLSVKDFLENDVGFPIGTEAHSRMADLCLKKLTRFFDVEASPRYRMWDLGHFISYAITFMPFHLLAARNATDETAPWKELVRSATSTPTKGGPLYEWLRTIWTGIHTSGTIERLKSSPYPNVPSGLNLTPDLTPLNIIFHYDLMDLLSDITRMPTRARNFRLPAYKKFLRSFCNWTNEDFEKARRAIPQATFMAILDLEYAVEVAAALGRSSMIEKLLQHGARIEPEIGGGFPALHIATSKRDFESVRILLKRGANVQLLNSAGWTALHHDVWWHLHSDIDITRLLVEHGANLDQIEPLRRRTPLLNALFGSCIPSNEVLAFLLKMGAEIDTSDKFGNTVMHAATNRLIPRFTTVKLLLDWGADPSRTNNLGQTALDFVIANGSHFVFDLLVQRGADLSVRIKDGATYLHYAAERLRHKKPNYLYIVQGLKRSGLDINAGTASGETPLHWATRGPANVHHGDLHETKEALERMQFLIQVGADVYLKDGDGKTALDWAVDLGLEEVAAMLKWYMERRKSIFGPFDYIPYWYNQRKEGIGY